MAGIGFRLQKLLSGESYLDLIKAYLYSAVIATGPMIVVMMTLAVVKTAIQSQLGIENGKIFLGLIVYIYAFSTIGVGPLIYIVTRYLADKHFLKEIEAFTPTYIAVLEILFVVQSVVAFIFLYFVPITFASKWFVWTLYIFVNGIWIAMIFLSAARSYMWLVGAFIVGAVLGIALSMYLGLKMGFDGFLLGFTIGQGVTFFVLTARIFIEFGFTRGPDYDFLGYYKKYPLLALIGTFYYLGIWIDKFVFWYSPYGEQVGRVMYIFPEYDSPIFLAYLTIIPSMAFFLMQMETSFFKCYSSYYESVRNKAELDVIRERKEIVIKTLTANFIKFVIFQGVLSGLIIMFIFEISEAFYLNPSQVGILRISILGAFLFMGFIIILIILFYFDFRKDTFMMSLIFFITNGVFSYITTQIGFASFGFGFTAACFVSVLIGFLILDYKLKYLNYWTFMVQPILIPQFKFESEGEVRNP